MEQIKNFEDFVDEKLQMLEEEIKAYKQLKLDLNVPAIKGGLSISSSVITDSILTKPDDWPKKLIDKIARIVVIENRAVKFSEIHERFALIEGDKPAKKMHGSLSTCLSNLVHKGVLVGCQFNNERKQTFYVKPDWISEEEGIRKIKPEFWPAAEAIAGLSEEQLSPENILWKEKPNTNQY